MRLLGRRKDLLTPLIEEEAAVERLKKVSGRGNDEKTLYPVRPEQPVTAPTKRLFWTPDELLDAVP